MPLPAAAATPGAGRQWRRAARRTTQCRTATCMWSCFAAARRAPRRSCCAPRPPRMCRSARDGTWRARPTAAAPPTKSARPAPAPLQPASALRILDGVRVRVRLRVTPDIVAVMLRSGTRMALNALMNVYTATGDAAAAAAVLEGMQQRGPAPNDISFNTAIAAHAQARRKPPSHAIRAHAGQPALLLCAHLRCQSCACSAPIQSSLDAGERIVLNGALPCSLPVSPAIVLMPLAVPHAAGRGRRQRARGIPGDAGGGAGAVRADVRRAAARVRQGRRRGRRRAPDRRHACCRRAAGRAGIHVARARVRAMRHGGRSIARVRGAAPLRAGRAVWG